MPASFFYRNSISLPTIFCILKIYADRLRQPSRAACRAYHSSRCRKATHHLSLAPTGRNHHARRAAHITNHVAARQLITCAYGAIITARSALLPRTYAANNGHLQRKRALLFAAGFTAAAVCFYKHVAVEFGALFAAHFVPARGEKIDSLCIWQCIYALCPSLFKPHFGGV